MIRTIDICDMERFKSAMQSCALFTALITVTVNAA